MGNLKVRIVELGFEGYVLDVSKILPDQDYYVRYKTGETKGYIGKIFKGNKLITLPPPFIRD